MGGRARWGLAPLVAIGLASCDAERADTVPLTCTTRDGAVSLNLYVNTRTRETSIWDNRARRWIALRSRFGRIYDDQFQVDRDVGGDAGFLIDRMTGAFHTAPEGLTVARNAPPAGTCERAPYLAVPPTPAGPPGPAPRF